MRARNAVAALLLRKRRTWRRRLLTTLGAATVTVTAFVATALADQTVWLNWTGTGAGATQQWQGHFLNYVETIPETYALGCANAQNSGTEFFGTWFCSHPGDGIQSTFMGVYLYAQAWNDSGNSQPLWAWAGWSP
jgi:hypothetical protein